MKSLFTKFSAFLVLVLMGFGLHAQRTVSGTITDSENSEPIIGANVLVKGTTIGTITDFDGKYSLVVPAGKDVLVISYVGYDDQEVALGTGNVADASLVPGGFLDEVVVVGYGSQKEKEITSSVVRVTNEEFNRGAINDAAQLIQGKVSGLQVYNRGGDPNRPSTLRLRGISTVGANVEPLIVVDGIIGASLSNVDPNDIESFDVLKDGSAAAIYGSRGSSGVIIITTKKGSQNKGITMNYNGQYGISQKTRTIALMNASEFKAAGGTDLGADVDWLKEVTRGGTNSIHSLSAQGGSGNTTYRISGNLRGIDGILRGSGFDQFNTRLNISTKALNDKLKIDFNTSYTDRKSQFGFQEALRYAVTYNPTAPILGENSLYPFNSAQFGGYFETLGLFDSFNPVSIVEQNRNDGKKKEFNYGANLGYNLLDNLTVNFRMAQQSTTNKNVQYNPTTSFFRGNATSPQRKGRAEIYNDDISFKLYEPYVTYIASLGSSTNLTLTGGYSYQQNNFESTTMVAGDFPDNSLDYSNRLETSQDLKNAGFISLNSDASPDEKIIAFFGRANATINDAIFLNASVRREGSTKLGKDNQWGIFPAFGAGVDLTKYANLGGLDVFKFRVGYGVTGSLPIANGLANEIYTHEDAANGGVTTKPARKSNPNLKWEEKGETNIGLDFGTGRLSGSVDVYQRAIKDFILEVPLDVAKEGFPSQIQNAGKLSTKGLELALNYNLVKSGNVDYTTGVVFSTYKTVLDEYLVDAQMRANLGAPGQNGTPMIRVQVGEEIGNIWGPVFSGVNDKGSPIFEDLNGDGKIVAAADKGLDPDADMRVLGNGIPDFELGWRNNLEIGGWNINAFFRGAFGHSLVNSFRAFYEPQVSSQTSYNFMNTSLKVDGLRDARFSSLYVEKADFFKLDNLTISRNIPISSKAINNLNVSLTGQNLLVLTGYTGADPEPSLVDYGTVDNGTAVDYTRPDVLSPGIDRRNNYFNARTIILGVNFNF